MSKYYKDLAFDASVVEEVEDLVILNEGRRVLCIQIKTREHQKDHVVEAFSSACKYYAVEEKPWPQWAFWTLQATEQQISEAELNLTSLAKEKLKAKFITQLAEVKRNWTKSASAKTNTQRKKAANQGLAETKKLNECSVEEVMQKLKKLPKQHFTAPVKSELKKMELTAKTIKFLETNKNEDLEKMFKIQQIPTWEEVQADCYKVLMRFYECENIVARIMFAVVMDYSVSKLGTSRHKREDGTIKCIDNMDSINNRKIQIKDIQKELKRIAEEGLKEGGCKKLQEEYKKHLQLSHDFQYMYHFPTASAEIKSELSLSEAGRILGQASRGEFK